MHSNVLTCFIAFGAISHTLGTIIRDKREYDCKQSNSLNSLNSSDTFKDPVDKFFLQNSNSNNDDEQKNPFWNWLTSILGGTTTMKPTPLVPAKDCPECGCGKIKSVRRIVGGQETMINQYPWMAMLYYSKRFYCGGSLINDRYVVTAAHCVHGFNADRIHVRLLEHDRTKPDQTQTVDIKVKRILKHPRYSSTTYNNDIAIIQLTEPVQFEGILNPVCLASPGKSYTGHDAIVTGWGTTKEGGDVAQTLQEVTVPVLSNAECKKTGYSPTRITDNMLCAGFKEGKKDSCQGDSGGPLHVMDGEAIHQLVGVVSWGDGCAKPNYPGVYARVNRYLTWIRNNTIDGCSCTMGLK